MMISEKMRVTLSHDRKSLPYVSPQNFASANIKLLNINLCFSDDF